MPDVHLTLIALSADDAPAALPDGEGDSGRVRLTLGGEGLSAIPLYAETPVVVIPREHVVAAVDEIAVEDLADDVVLHPLDDILEWAELPGVPAKERPATTADAIELVAAG